MMLALQDRILERFRQLGLQPGDAIPAEQMLADGLGVSRPVLRESLAALEAFGAVNARQGARRTLGQFDMEVVVRRISQTMQPSTEVLLELLDVRRVLEVAFFSSAVAQISVKKIRELRSITDKMHARASQGLAFIDEDAAFHDALYAELDNKTLHGLLGAFWLMFEQTSAETRVGRNLPETARSHSRIVDALEAGDTPLAIHQLNVHFFDVRSRLVSVRAHGSGSPTPADQRPDRQRGQRLSALVE